MHAIARNNDNMALSRGPMLQIEWVAQHPVPRAVHWRRTFVQAPGISSQCLIVS